MFDQYYIKFTPTAVESWGDEAFRGVVDQGHPAVANGPVKQVTWRRGMDVQVDRDRSRAVAKYGHVVGVPAKTVDVVSTPPSDCFLKNLLVFLLVSNLRV